MRIPQRLLQLCVLIVIVVPNLSNCTLRKLTRSPEEQLAAEQEEVLKERAAEFDQFLMGQKDKREVATIKEKCEKGDDNLFCFSIINYDALEERAIKDSNKSRRSPLVAAKFRKKKILNWLELRFSPIPSLLKGISLLSPAEKKLVKERALTESHCPNNIAIALGAVLEDSLPEHVDMGELGKLYERGGDCFVKDPSERKTLLSRSGIFYYGAKKYSDALRVLSKAVELKDTYRAQAAYWLYRTQLALGKLGKAEDALNILRDEYPFSFHALVALLALEQDPGEILQARESPKKTRSEQSPVLNILLEQAEQLQRFGYPQSASKVLDWALSESDGAEPQLMLYLSELKTEQGDYRSTISILSGVLYDHPQLISRDTMEKYFPRVYFPIFERKSSGLDPYLLIAIARRESAFNPRAVSSANARGLLQLTPATAKRTNRKANLMDPESNIETGSMYLLDLLSKTNGQIHLSLAAYNAGPARLNEWVKRYPVDDPILFIDMIPFRETREYVAAVLRNYYWYRRIHQTDQPLSAKTLLEWNRPTEKQTN